MILMGLGDTIILNYCGCVSRDSMKNGSSSKSSRLEVLLKSSVRKGRKNYVHFSLYMCVRLHEVCGAYRDALWDVQTTLRHGRLFAQTIRHGILNFLF